MALITDILKDENGVIQKIEVSEAIRPTCVRIAYDVEEYFEHFKLFALWRYDFVDSVPMPDEEQDRLLKQGVPALPAIALDYGNKTNYRIYEDVVLSAFPEGENEIEISREGEVIETVTIFGRGNISRRFPRGYYQVKHVATGETLEFCVTQPEITHFVENGKLTVKADACDPESVISHFEFREMTRSEREKLQGKDPENAAVAFYSDSCAALSKMEELTQEEKKTGIITREIPQDAVHFKVSFENKYGIWTHTMIRIQ